MRYCIFISVLEEDYELLAIMAFIQAPYKSATRIKRSAIMYLLKVAE